MNRDIIFKLFSRPETVFSFDEVAQLFPDISDKSLRDRLHYFVKTKKLERVRHGIYAKREFNKFELANKIYTPSYVSLETVLFEHGIVFQVYETIFLMSYLTRSVKVQAQEFQFRRLPMRVLTNMNGIIREAGYFIASRERAFLDAIYVYKNYHFDNLGGVNWEKIFEIAKIYDTKKLIKRVEKLYKEEHSVQSDF